MAGGAAKPWRQKGTGRARQGTIRAPQWTGGGVVFGPHPRDYTGKINRKAHLKAIRIALSAHAADGTLAAIDGSALSEPRTKLAAELVSGWRSERPLVLVVAPRRGRPRTRIPQSRAHARGRGRPRGGGRPGLGAVADRVQVGACDLRGR